MKTKTFLSRINDWTIFIVMTLGVIAIVVASTLLINYLRKDEVKRVSLLTKAIKIQQATHTPDSETLALLPEILSINNSIPFIVTDKNEKPFLDYGYHKNIAPDIISDSVKLKKLLNKMKSNYKPIEIQLPENNNQYVFYDNSVLLNDLKYSPYILGCFILLYLIFSFWFMRTMKKKDEGFLWAGLAKETAHQIGTPLSSMIGWIEIMKMETPDALGTKEIEKDIIRLKTISERFSKIGSVPELNDLNIKETLQQNYDYLKSRISTKVKFTLTMEIGEILVRHNRILMSWVIENLTKNAVDAMKGVGTLDLILYEKGNNVIIDFKDSGCGMTKKQARNVFKPGYSTKKRGWGLGLSLARRVINDFHRADIRVVQSEPGKGTTFRITLKIKNYKQPRV